jgi:hypothetical protein
MKPAIEKLSRQLAEYSHKDLAVVIMPRHSFAAGQAHGENAIILDPLDTEGDNNLFAYRIAHEWAHEALGHEPSAYNLDGQTYQFRRSSVLDESEADRFAGDFLAQYGYSIEPVCSALQVYRAIPWDSRTPGAVRCRLVKDSYQQAIARMAPSNATQIAQGRLK